MGGLFSYIPASVTTIVATETVSFVNTGDLVATGTIGESSGAFIGGIAGSTASPITGAKVKCNIKAYTPQQDAVAIPLVNTQVGMVTGADHAAGTVEAKDCVIGGTICTEQKQEGSWTDDEQILHPGEISDKVISINAENLHEYIYGSSVAVDLLNGCTIWE